MILELSCLLIPDLWCDPQTYLLELSKHAI